MGSRHRILAWIAFAAAALAASCSVPEPDPDVIDPAAAEQALESFLGLLAEGRYDEAAVSYAGPLDGLQTFNPELDPQDPAALIGYACDQRLLQCLPVRSITPLEIGAEGAATFSVEFSLEDGSLFVLGPCCGATPTEMPPVSAFTFHLQMRSDGSFGVLDLPPFVP